MNNTQNRLHINLLKYFESKLLDEHEYNNRIINYRKLIEQPWQSIQANQQESLKHILSDFDFFMITCTYRRHFTVDYWNYLKRYYSPVETYNEIWPIWEIKYRYHFRQLILASKLIGSLLEDLGYYKNALKYFEISIEQAIEICGVDGITTLKISNNIGEILNKTLDHTGSTDMTEKVLQKSTKKFGHYHIVSLIATNILANNYLVLNKHNKAYIFHNWTLRGLGEDYSQFKETQLKLIKDRYNYLIKTKSFDKALIIKNKYNKRCIQLGLNNYIL